MIFSQMSLRPEVIEKSGDTLFCFSQKQAKFLASHLEKSVDSDMLLKCYKKQQEDMERLIEIKDSLIAVQQREICDKDSLQQLSESEILSQQDEITSLQKEIKQMQKERKIYRLKTSVFGVLLLAVSVLGLLK